MYIVWISRFNKLYPLFKFIRKLGLIKICPCNSWKRFTITKVDNINHLLRRV